MKITHFVELFDNGKNKMLKGDQLQQFVAKTIEVKKYIGIKEKKVLIDNIINDCIVYENSVFKFDEVDKYIVFTMRTIAAYTNLELSADMEDDYDMLCESNLLNVIITTFMGEYENVKLLLQMKCDYVVNSNTLEAQFGKFLAEVLDKVNVLTGALSDKVNNFDFNNLPINMDDLGKLMEFVDSQKK